MTAADTGVLLKAERMEPSVFGDLAAKLKATRSRAKRPSLVQGFLSVSARPKTLSAWATHAMIVASAILRSVAPFSAAKLPTMYPPTNPVGRG